MAEISRRYNFEDGTVAIADQVDEELNQLIEGHNDQEGTINAHIIKQVDVESTDETRDKHVSNKDIKSINDSIEDIYSGGLDPRYYTKDQLTPFLSGGDTLIVEETFTIVNGNLGNGQFSYQDKTGATILGPITNGYQVFALTLGYYQLNGNRAYAMLNDSVRRSVASGGLLEVDTTHIGVVQQNSGVEVTFVYFQRTGLTGEHNVIVGPTQPPQGDDNTLWFKVV